MLTVFGLVLLRIKNKEEKGSFYKSPLFPIPAIIFLAASVWMITFFAMNEPMKLVFGLLSMLPGVIIYFLTVKTKKTQA
jgi:amino acid transporter